MYVGCYVTWAAKLQTEVALRTTEDEFIAMSEGLRIVTQLMRFIEEMVEKRVKDLTVRPKMTDFLQNQFRIEINQDLLQSGLISEDFLCKLIFRSFWNSQVSI